MPEHPDPLGELDLLIGPVASLSLQTRHLLPPVGPGRPAGVAASGVPADRILGAFIGAAFGAAIGAAADDTPPRCGPSVLDDRVRFDLRADELTALCLQIDALGASHQEPGADLGGEGLALRLGAAATQHRSLATAAFIARLERGAPWHEAGVSSYGSAALPRAVAHGVWFADDPEWRPVAASVDCAVTHAHPRATSIAALVAEAVAWCLVTDRPTSPGITDELITHLADWHWVPRLSTMIRRLSVSTTDPGRTPTRSGPRLRTEDATARRALLASLTALAATGAHPPDAMLAVIDYGGNVGPAATLTGALLGALHGWTWTSAAPAIGSALLPQLDLALDTLTVGCADFTSVGSATPRRATIPAPAAPVGPHVSGSEGDAVHVMFLLDRSGSMHAIADDVVGGFNGFLAEQKVLDQPDCTMTVVQFDGNDPFDVMVDARPLAGIHPLSADTFQPRGNTPLYDAIDAAITHTDAHVAARHNADGTTTDVVVVVFTDGHENASRRCSRSDVFTRIASRQDHDDWTFVFLGSNQDAYESGGRLGMADGNTSNWRATPYGTDTAFRSVSRGLRTLREKAPYERRRDRTRFFDGYKEAEDR